MPIKVPDDLPAKAILESEHVFVMGTDRAFHQDIRPLRILILNLMPLKETTETQLLRLLSNTPLQLEITLLRVLSREGRHTPLLHLQSFYAIFDDVRDQKFDGMIITGAPVEHLRFEDVTYWDELTAIMEWTKHNVTSTLHICWGAQAGLYYHYQIPKYPLDSKMFGVFLHDVVTPVPLVRGFDEQFLAPHSRLSEVRVEDIQKEPNLILVSASEEAGVYIVVSRDGRQVFVSGHAEYDIDTLMVEYNRDKQKGMDVQLPQNYFPDDNPKLRPMHNWKSHAHLLFSNWLNYYVYQTTPFDLDSIR